MRRGVRGPGTPTLLTALTSVVASGCLATADRNADEFGGGDQPDPTATTTPVSPCRARVVLTGAVAGSWSGAATVAATEFAGSPAVCVARHGDTEVRLFAPDRGYAPTVEVDADEEHCGISPPDSGSIHADRSGADVRTTAIRTGIGGPDLHVEATFRC